MEELRPRTAFQGVGNIVRFNWHMFAIAGVVALVAGSAAFAATGPVRWLVLLVVAAALGGMALSLFVSYLVYDRSALYELPWLAGDEIPPAGILVTLSAGFDEVSPILRNRFPGADLRLWDFYDQEKHTEVSIRRARKAYPPHPATVAVGTGSLPLGDGEADMICLMLSAHEIRDPAERRAFFLELRRILAREGRIWVCEHLRDPANFLAYSVGAFHFHSKQEWLSVFIETGFEVVSERKITPLVSVFTLEMRS